jgi:uncharacterized RDD family membrane protein YckC
VQVDDRLTIATPEGVDLDLVLAGLGSRFLARAVDTLVQVGGILALLLVTGGAATLSDDADGWVAAVAIVALFLVLFAYDAAFEALDSGRTPGKRAAGIRVVGMRGEPIGFVTAAIRNIVRIVDFLPLLYLTGTLFIVASSRNQRLGDLAAGTLVVRERFGGRAKVATHAQTDDHVTVTPEAVATWDVGAVTPDELRAIRAFLRRRLELPWHVRTYLGDDLASRVRAKVVGAPRDTHPEYVLEGVVVAKDRDRSR